LVVLFYSIGDIKKAKVYHGQVSKLYPNNKQVLYNNEIFNKINI
jgi:hypothetical protein